MGFGTDYTEEELAQLREIEEVFNRLYPENSTETELGISVATLRTFFVRSAKNATSGAAKWCAALQEIHSEAVVRLGQNLRNTKTVTNRLLKWRTAFSVCERSTSTHCFGSDSGRAVGQAWMKGIVQYYKDRLESCFGELNISSAEANCVPVASTPSRGSRAGATAHLTPATDGEQLVTLCISSARAVVNPQMSSSPYFLQAVRTCREMVLVLQVIQGLLNAFSLHHKAKSNGSVNVGQRRAATLDLNFSDDHLVSLRTPQWLFRFIFLFLGVMDLLQDPQRDRAELSGNQLDYAIHCIACLVGELDSKRKDSDVKTTLDALVLGHVKNSCLTKFPPQQTLNVLAQLRDGGGSAGGEESAAEDALLRREPVLNEVLVRYPDFMSAITHFSRRNSVEEWGLSTMLAVLYCWDTKKPPLASTAHADKAVYQVPNQVGPNGYRDDEFEGTVVYSLAREALWPLLSRLLSISHTIASGTGTAAPTSAAGADATEAAAGSGGAALLSSQEQNLCALLLGVVSWLDTIDFPEAAHMANWKALDIGPQVMREFHLGRWCMQRVLRVELPKVIGAALEQLEAQVRSASDTAAAQDDLFATLSAPLLRYLLRVERIWNAITEPTIELESGAIAHLRDMGVSVLPKRITTVDFSAADTAHDPASRARYDTRLLADGRDGFYEAVQASMQARWPKNYADLLTDPLLHSIHAHLVQAESATQRGLGPRPGGAAAGPRGGGPAGPGAKSRTAGMKRPPPRSGEGDAGPAAAPVEAEVVRLVSKEDLYGALRLVRCIKNRDHFIQCYTDTVRERLLTRPAPEIIGDADLEKNKKRCEKEVEQFLASWLDDATLLKTVRELHSNYTPQSHTFSTAAGSSGRDLKLTSTILEWPLWGDKETVLAASNAEGTEASPAALPTTAAELHAATAQAASTAASDTAPLPFPMDALPHLEQVEQRYNSDHSSRALRWDWRSHVFTTFTLLYPKDNGRITTVSGTLLLQRLFLAIAAYGRAGVELSTLASRAGMKEQRVLAVLKPCLYRDGLLVRVGQETGVPAPQASAAMTTAAAAATGPANASPVSAGMLSMRLALNYDFTRPPNRPRGDFIYWPSMDRRRPTTRGADQDVTMKKRYDIIKTSIMQVMKQIQRIHHDKLYATVREKNAKSFEVTVRNFKQGIEDLIGNEFMARAENNPHEYVFRA